MRVPLVPVLRRREQDGVSDSAELLVRNDIVDTAETSFLHRGSPDSTSYSASYSASAVEAKSAKELAAARKEAESAKEQLHHFKRALMDERLVRAELAAEAERKIASLRQQLIAAVQAAHQGREASTRRRMNAPVTLTLIAAVVAALALFSRVFWPPTGVPGSPDEPEPPPAVTSLGSESPEPLPIPGSSPSALAAVSRPVVSTPAPVPRESQETEALNRLGEALRPIPAAAVAPLLGSVNQWLRNSSEPPCAIQSPNGEMTLAIAPGSGKPLLAALARCASGVERLTRGAPGRPPP